MQERGGCAMDPMWFYDEMGDQEEWQGFRETVLPPGMTFDRGVGEGKTVSMSGVQRPARRGQGCRIQGPAAMSLLEHGVPGIVRASRQALFREMEKDGSRPERYQTGVREAGAFAGPDEGCREGRKRLAGRAEPPGSLGCA